MKKILIILFFFIAITSFAQLPKPMKFLNNHFIFQWSTDTFTMKFMVDSAVWRTNQKYTVLHSNFINKKGNNYIVNDSILNVKFNAVGIYSGNNNKYWNCTIIDSIAPGYLKRVLMGFANESLLKYVRYRADSTQLKMWAAENIRGTYYYQNFGGFYWIKHDEDTIISVDTNYYFRYNRSPSNGYVLTSDAKGYATWQSIGTAAWDSIYLKNSNENSPSGWYRNDTIKIDTTKTVLYGTAVDSSLILTTIKFPIGYALNAIVVDSLFTIATAVSSANFKFKIRYGTSIADTGIALINNPSAVTSITAVTRVGAFNNGTIPAKNMIWLVFTDVTTKPRNVLVQIKGH